jgi:hypothetical protein
LEISLNKEKRKLMKNNKFKTRETQHNSRIVLEPAINKSTGQVEMVVVRSICECGNDEILQILTNGEICNERTAQELGYRDYENDAYAVNILDEVLGDCVELEEELEEQYETIRNYADRYEDDDFDFMEDDEFDFAKNEYGELDYDQNCDCDHCTYVRSLLNKTIDDDCGGADDYSSSSIINLTINVNLDKIELVCAINEALKKVKLLGI